MTHSRVQHMVSHRMFIIHELMTLTTAFDKFMVFTSIFSDNVSIMLQILKKCLRKHEVFSVLGNTVEAWDPPTCYFV